MTYDAQKKELCILDLEACLIVLGARAPFDTKGNLTNQGEIAFNTLRELLFFMESQGVVKKVNEDKLDRIFSERAY